MQNCEVLDFSLIKHFFVHFTRIYLFVLFKVNVENGKILDFSTIEHFLFIPTKICSMELINEISRIPLDFKKIILHVFIRTIV